MRIIGEHISTENELENRERRRENFKMTKPELKRLIQIQRDAGMPWHTPGKVRKDLDFLLQIIMKYLVELKDGQEMD